MIRCDECDRMFDSDDDPDCFVEAGNMRRMTKDAVICEGCRDTMERNHELRLEP